MVHRRHSRRLGRPPGPPQHWLFGNLREFGRDRLGIAVALGSRVRRSRLGPIRPAIRSSSSIIPTWSKRCWSTRIANSSSTTG